MPIIGTATFQWLTAMLALPQRTCPPRICKAVALDWSCRLHLEYGAPHRSSVDARRSGPCSGGTRIVGGSEAEREGSSYALSETPEYQSRTRSRERCARATALSEDLERLSDGVRLPGAIRHPSRWAHSYLLACAQRSSAPVDTVHGGVSRGRSARHGPS